MKLGNSPRAPEICGRIPVLDMTVPLAMRSSLSKRGRGGPKEAELARGRTSSCSKLDAFLLVVPFGVLATLNALTLLREHVCPPQCRVQQLTQELRRWT